jgi:hypothetical protein
MDSLLHIISMRQVQICNQSQRVKRDISTMLDAPGTFQWPSGRETLAMPPE